MRFLKSVPGAALIVIVIALATGTGMTAVRVWRVTHPERQPELPLNLGAELAKLEQASFKAADGTDPEGWLFRGTAGAPPDLRCYDLQESKSALLNLAIALNKAGFNVLAFDFRGHGASAGRASTLGTEEARDVLGAIDFLGDLPAGEVDARRIGVFGA